MTDEERKEYCRACPLHLDVCERMTRTEVEINTLKNNVESFQVERNMKWITHEKEHREAVESQSAKILEAWQEHEKDHKSLITLINSKVSNKSLGIAVTIIIFVVGLGVAWIKEGQSTTNKAILALSVQATLTETLVRQHMKYSGESEEK